MDGRLVGTCSFVALLALGGHRLSASIEPLQSPPDLDRLIARIGERVGDFYRRAQTVMCLERSTVQPVRHDWGIEGLARSVESDLRVELEAPTANPAVEPSVIREIRAINGRAPSERDAKSTSGCTDPNPLSPEPLAFLLPAHRSEYRFPSMKSGKEHDRPALIIDFQTVNHDSHAELIEDERGHPDCFDWKGPIARSGRVWVDAETNDVLKVESHLNGPVDIRVSRPLQRRYHLAQWITLERDDQTLKYKTFRFTDPDEILLLPASIESLTLIRNDLQSIRRTDTFSDYRRFRTSSRIKRGS